MKWKLSNLIMAEYVRMYERVREACVDFFNCSSAMVNYDWCNGNIEYFLSRYGKRFESFSLTMIHITIASKCDRRAMIYLYSLWAQHNNWVNYFGQTVSFSKSTFCILCNQMWKFLIITKLKWKIEISNVQFSINVIIAESVWILEKDKTNCKFRDLFIRMFFVFS